MNTILALAPNWLGDAAMCTPALRALRRRFPEAALVVAGRCGVCELLDGLPSITRTVVLPDSFWSARETLRTAARRSDLAVVFPHSFRAALHAWASGARRRIGYARGGRSVLLTDPVAPRRVNGRIEPIYMAREYLELIAPLGCDDDGAGLELAVRTDLAETIRHRLPPGGPLVGIAPGAAFGPSKLWPPERFAAVADALAERAHARCLLITGPNEESLAQRIPQLAKYPLIRCDERKPTIQTLKATISLLDLLICNDSGPRHVAVAFNVPTVCIMGPTSPKYSEGPYERGAVLRVEVDCGPCQKPVCATDHRCMTRITADWVVETATSLLKEVEAQSHDPVLAKGASAHPRI